MRTKTIAILLATLASLGATIAPALAQDGVRREQQVDNRQENQQDRIGQGVTSGQLTAGEAARLEGRQARFDRITARQQATGHFTPANQRRDNRIANRDSRAIYRFKHNGRHQ